MNRSDLIRALADNSKMTQAEAEEVLNGVTEAILISLACGESVTIRNFGKFEVRTRKPVTRLNPRTGEEISVPEKNSVLFHASPAMKKRVNK